MEIDPLQRLNAYLARWILWYRFRRAFQWAERGLALGLGLSLAVALFGMFQGLLLREEYLRSILLGTASLTVLLAAGAFFWPFPVMHAARYFDQQFDLKERVSTALGLARHPGGTQTEVEIARLQLKDALTASAPVHLRSRLPIRINWPVFFISVLLAASSVAGWYLGGSHFQAAEQKRAVQQTIQKETAKIEELRSQILSDPSLSPEQRQELTRPLEEALKGLKNSASLESAVSVLQSTQEKLQALSNPQARQMAQDLQAAGQQLSQSARSPLQPFGQSLANGNFQQAAQDLNNLDLSQLSSQERQTLARQLENTAESIQASNPTLAQQLNQAAQALKNGDTPAASQSLSQAAQTLAQAGGQIAQSEAAGKAASAVAQSQQQVLQSGQNAQTALGNGNSNPNGQTGSGQGQGSSSQPGQGQGQGSSSQGGQGNNGGGAGRGEGSGEGGQGPQAGNQPIEQGNGPGDGGEKAYEQIYSPQHLGGSGSDQVLLPQSGQPGDQITGQANTSPGIPGQSSVP